MERIEKTQAAVAVAGLLAACANMPDLVQLVRGQSERLNRIETAIEGLRATPKDSDCWLDAKEAARYMGISNGTFDKYRYKTTPHIRGYALDGKVLYKKSDLDQFVKLYSAEAP